MKHINLILIFLLIFNQSNSQQLTKQYESLKYKNFKISYEKELNPEDVKFIAIKIDSLLNEWKLILKIKRVRNIEFRMYKSDKSYKNKTNVKFNQDVYHNQNIIHLSPKIFDRKSLSSDKILVNAVILALLSESGKRGCPKWLIDSYAIYFSGLKESEQQATLNISGNLKDFKQEYSQLKKETQYNAFLSKSFHFIDFVNKRYGNDKLNFLFKAFNGKRSEEEAFEFALGEKFEEIEKAWNNFIKRN
ncbi:MAG: hypothetical protein IGBAC_2143 [Ignavibacteriae bacterium]|nr:MAG: hypothetical protein IGBAC_2143 [Ignavibacteriota bacterium]